MISNGHFDIYEQIAIHTLDRAFFDMFSDTGMDVKQIDATQSGRSLPSSRPADFGSFVGQHAIKLVLDDAITSAQTRQQPIGHVLFSGPSGYGKTTLAQIVAQQLGAGFKVITAYAISKPAEMVSVLNSLDRHDILFIDELHRLKAPVEEVLYIAMEEYCIDMVMPDGGSVRVPLAPFTLIGATTKLEALTTPLKNRFIYKFHFSDYTDDERLQIIQRYLDLQQIELTTSSLRGQIAERSSGTPRDIANLCIQLRDFLVANGSSQGRLSLTQQLREQFRRDYQVDHGGITPLHQRYLAILDTADGRPVGLKTIAVKLGLHEKSIEQDIEPLLFKLGKIDKTPRGRVLV